MSWPAFRVLPSTANPGFRVNKEALRLVRGGDIGIWVFIAELGNTRPVPFSSDEYVSDFLRGEHFRVPSS
jgi:hypothetical protein